jgi:hypothetical protein
MYVIRKILYCMWQMPSTLLRPPEDLTSHAYEIAIYLTTLCIHEIAILLCHPCYIHLNTFHRSQMFASAKLDMHHKSDDANKNHFFLVRWYYGYYYFFGYCCVGAEFSYVLLYILSNVSNAVGGDSNSMIVHTEWVQLALYLVLPGCAIKQLVNVVQLCSACHSVAANDAEHKTK